MFFLLKLIGLKFFNNKLFLVIMSSIFELIKTGRKIMAGWTGLEPATSGVTGQRCNQLYYHPTTLMNVCQKANCIARVRFVFFCPLNCLASILEIMKARTSYFCAIWRCLYEERSLENFLENRTD